MLRFIARGMTSAPTAMSARAKETRKQKVVSLSARLILTAQTTITLPSTEDTARKSSTAIYRAWESEMGVDIIVHLADVETACSFITSPIGYSVSEMPPVNWHYSAHRSQQTIATHTAIKIQSQEERGDTIQSIFIALFGSSAFRPVCFQ
ncbi:UNVERIFIED_CONTAM: hypothetical protein FKN15_057718 [Acipenser sinensis]